MEEDDERANVSGRARGEAPALRGGKGAPGFPRKPGGRVAAALDELAFGRVYTRPGLDLKTRSMLTVPALTVLGRDDYLRRHLQGALHVGVTPAEIKEIRCRWPSTAGCPSR